MSDIKRVFLITVDCLRGDYVGCIGGGNLTPNIDGFAENSLLFRRAFANGPGTNQSFPAILTSTYFLMHDGMRLSPRCTTLAEVLSRNGFKTVAFHSNPFLSKILGWDRGFDEFYDYVGIIKSPSAFVTQQQGSGLKNEVTRFLATYLGASGNARTQRLLKKIYYRFSSLEIPYLEGKKLNRQVFDWIDKNLDNRFFLWMHYMDPHYPYIPPEPYLKNFSSRKEAFNFNISANDDNPSNEELEAFRSLYIGEIKYTDKCIGKTIEFLEDKHLLEDSIVVFTADHGHGFMEHGKFAHAYDILYNEVLHVPLIIYGLDIQRKVDDYVQSLDIAPTITDLVGIETPRSFIGDNLIKRARSPTERGKTQTPIYSESAKPDLINLKYDFRKHLVSCLIPPFKLMVNRLSKTVELYNIEKDFEERENIIDSRGKLHKEMALLVENHLCRVKECRENHRKRFN